jgi:hypothetical protein
VWQDRRRSATPAPSPARSPPPVSPRRGWRPTATAPSGALDTWDRAPYELWLAVAGLNIIAPALILCTGIWRLWPFAPPAPTP